MNYLELAADAGLTMEQCIRTSCPRRVQAGAPSHYSIRTCPVWQMYGMHFEKIADPAKRNVCLECWQGKIEPSNKEDDVP